MPLAVAALVASGSSNAAAAEGSGADFRASVVVNELHATLRSTWMSGDSDVAVVHWRGDRMRRISASGMPVERVLTEYARGTEVYSSLVRGRARRISTSRGMSPAPPDASALLGWDLMRFAWPLVAHVRRGGAPLTEVTVGTRELLRATTRVHANECAGLRAGTRRVDLDADTLVPVRVVERRGGRTTLDLAVTTRGRRTTDFARIPISGVGFAPIDHGFRYRTPAQADALLAFDVSMPTTIPEGFTLFRTGSAAQGGVMGPEGSFTRSRGAYFATWRRGLEELHLTIRGARGTLARDWDRSDPFGAECSFVTTTTVAVGSSTARYAYDDDGAPRLWWREGTTLYTLSGAYSAEQLATVANSLTAIAG